MIRKKKKYNILIVMVYATINEVWGNSFVIEEPIKNIANFESFHDNFKNKSIEQKNRLKYNDSIRVQTKKHNRNDIYINNDDISEDTNSSDSISRNSFHYSSNIVNNSKNTHRKNIYKNNDREPELEKIIGKKVNTHPIKKVKEHFRSYNCEDILEHIKNCESCKSSIDSKYKNDFLREFVIFASSGVLIFIFLELLVKIAKK